MALRWDVKELCRRVSSDLCLSVDFCDTDVAWDCAVMLGLDYGKWPWMVYLGTLTRSHAILFTERAAGTRLGDGGWWVPKA
jgi:hypothetical protein